MGEVHGVTATSTVSAQDAERIARLMSALGTASRVRILARLRQAPCSVTELTETVEMAQPAVSHQLRILRDLGLVVGARDGRNTVYTLHDPHVAMLLDEALRHIKHLHAGAVPDTEPDQNSGNTAERRRVMTDEHTHQTTHAHEHDHGDTTHTHAHVEHDHEHVEHTHEHAHNGERHEHPHVHQAGQQDQHEHAHA